MIILRIALMLVAIHAAASSAAETRFLQISPDTVGGRKVTTAGGTVWEFHRDGRFVWRDKNRIQHARWSVAGAAIKLSWQNGNTSYYNPILIDGVTHVRYTIHANAKRGGGAGQARVSSIEPLE